MRQYSSVSQRLKPPLVMQSPPTRTNYDMIGAVLMTSDYDGGNIQILEGLEAVRVRSGMYIGGTGLRGLHNLVYGVLSNSLAEPLPQRIDKSLASRCQNIDISINDNGSITIVDDGGWISTEIYPETNKSTIELLFTFFYVGYCQVYSYPISDWLYGGEIPVLSALSSHIEVRVWRDRKIYIQHFERGIAVSELEIVSNESEIVGTMITFLPDPKIFKESIEFNFDILANRFRELAYLNAGIRMSLTDYRYEPKVEKYYYEGGIRDYIAYLNIDRQPLHEEVIYIRTEKNKVRVEIAFQWCRDTEERILGFGNTIQTHEGGVHLDGLKIAITRTLNKINHQRNKRSANSANLDGKYIRQGLSAIVSLMLANPEFEGATRTRLSNRGVRGIVKSISSDVLSKYFTSNPNIADTILERAIKAFDAAEMRKKGRELLRHQNGEKDLPRS
jgi:DNA gyrase subunit B